MKRLEIQEALETADIKQKSIIEQQKNKLDTESKMKAYDMALKESRQRHQMSIEDKKLENSRKWFWQT
jgi:hypothetical protein